MLSRIKRKLDAKYLFLAAVITIAIGSMYFTHVFFVRLKAEEHQKVLMIAGATRMLSNNNNLASEDLSFLLDIIQNNETVPLIVVDEKERIILERNLDLDSSSSRDEKIHELLNEMKKQYKPIEVRIDEDTRNYIYYSNSNLLKRVRWFPFFQVSLIGMMFLLASLVFLNRSRAERNLLWVGMSKETAHQLGTPISSLMAWVELLRIEDVDPNVIEELNKDVVRLEQIAQRFSTIGSEPNLKEEPIVALISESVDYMKNRISKKITLRENYLVEDNDTCPVNRTLIFWVIENMIKNAADAIQDHGNIEISVRQGNDQFIIDVSDSGKGIPVGLKDQVFDAGFTTKDRGWGLGLSLGKRIIESYHGGELSVYSSKPGVGTVMRILLSKGHKSFD